MAWIIIMLYGAALGIILFYGLFQFTLISHARKYKRKSETTQHPVLNIEQPQNVPFVTVQLPVYNEYYVVERLIDAVASLHYPKERLEIQVLDDSTDDTYDIIKRKVKEIQQSEINIKHLYRNDRIGYKAGALQYGLNQAEGEFIAIFDADFVPEPDFLINTLPQFDNEQVGMVQTRWGHINENYSLLTRMQAFGLNAHFKIEQTGRYHGGRFLNFNGTGGVWRKSCIEDAGGWQHDTIAEDLDLSYRAQLKGWKFVYLDHVEAPAELPVVISGLKSQQFRWTKGGAENFRKLSSKIISAKEFSLKTRLFALSHLMNNSLFIMIFLAGFLSVPALFIKNIHTHYKIIFNMGTVFLFATLIFSWFYWNAYQYTKKKKIFKPLAFIYDFILFLSFSMGLSLHNTVAVIEGYTGRKSSFIRTPKYNISSGKQNKTITRYLTPKINWTTWAEGILTFYFLAGIITGIRLNDFALFPFHTMFAFGFGMIFYYSIEQVWRKTI